VHFLARAPTRGANALPQITAAADDGNVTYGLGDLDDLGCVRAFAREFLRHERLDLLIHSAVGQWASSSTTASRSEHRLLWTRETDDSGSCERIAEPARV
jgi:NAD(P)-dependent dehydrogenase (short-subunit alcohol dehydrogenase family)